MMDYLTYKSGLSRLTLGVEYTMRGLIKLFLHFRIFDKIELLLHSPFMSKEDAAQAKIALEDLSDVFFKPTKKGAHLSKAELDEAKIEQLKAYSKISPWVKVHDKRQST